MFHQKIPRIESAILIVCIFIINALALKFSWYFYIWWFDMPVHFLGGLWLAYISFCVLSMFGYARQVSLRLVITILLLVMVVSVFWEVFEFSLDTIIRVHIQSHNLVDSLSDLFFDMAGGMSGIVLLYLSRYIQGDSTSKEH